LDNKTLCCCFISPSCPISQPEAHGGNVELVARAIHFGNEHLRNLGEDLAAIFSATSASREQREITSFFLPPKILIPSGRKALNIEHLPLLIEASRSSMT
jgi:hypothetical protein